MTRSESERNTDPADFGRPLSSADADELLDHLAELGRAAAPLADGLRAAAAECPNNAVGRALRHIAGRIDEGVPLQTILDDTQRKLPQHVRGLVAAAARTGQLGLALEQLVDHHRTTRAIWWGVAGSVVYPLTVLGITVVLLALLPLYIVPPFKSMFEDFGLALPMMTQLLINTSDVMLWVTESGRWILIGGFVVLLVCVFLLATGWGGSAVQRVLSTVPFVGPLWHWSGTAACTRLLSTLVSYGVPLPEALRLTAAGVRNAHVSDTCRWLADGAERGSTVSELLADSTRLPTSLVPLVRRGEQTGELAESLREASEMFTARLLLRAQLLRSVSPCLVFIVVFMIAGFTVVALFLPLVSLIQGLS